MNQPQDEHMHADARILSLLSAVLRSTQYSFLASFVCRSSKTAWGKHSFFTLNVDASQRVQHSCLFQPRFHNPMLRLYHPINLPLCCCWKNFACFQISKTKKGMLHLQYFPRQEAANEDGVRVIGVGPAGTTSFVNTSGGALSTTDVIQILAHPALTAPNDDKNDRPIC